MHKELSFALRSSIFMKRNSFCNTFWKVGVFFSKTLIFSICTFYFTAKQLLLNQLSKKREYKYVIFFNWTYRTELTETKLHNSTYMTVTMVTTTFSKSKVGQFKTVEYVFLIYILCFIDQEIIHKKTHYKYKIKTQMNNIQN